jgi:hypothetical protein
LVPAVSVSFYQGYAVADRCIECASISFTCELDLGLVAVPEPAIIPAGRLYGIVAPWQGGLAVICRTSSR